MQQPSGEWPDWREPGAYSALLAADRSLFAWEWLRRDPAYREAERLAGAGSAAQDDAAGFGLVRFEPPDRGCPQARPLWTSEAHPYVLVVEPAEAGGRAEDRIDLARLAGLATCASSGAEMSLLLSDGLRTIRLDGPGRLLRAAKPHLRYRIEGMASAEAPLRTLGRLLALCRTGRFQRSLHPPEGRARRWVLELRAFDAVCSDASQRDIAGEMFSRSAPAPGWRHREPSVRLQAQRLVRAARARGAGGWRAFLC